MTDYLALFEDGTPRQREMLRVVRAAGLLEESTAVPPAPELTNDARLAHWIERASHSVRRLIAREVRELGLGATQAALLLELEGQRDPTHDWCARRLRVSRAVVTRLLENLRTAGLVELHAFGFERRLRTPRLTAVGQERIEALKVSLHRVEVAIGSGLSPDERDLLCRLLARVDETTRWS